MILKKTLYISKTTNTPCINFNIETGVMSIEGRSIPNNSDEFWNPVIDWFNSYIETPRTNTKFVVQLEYLNISSSKKILALMYKLNDLIESGKSVQVEWHCRENDDDMFEVGQDYAYMVKVPFNFITVKEEVLAV